MSKEGFDYAALAEDYRAGKSYYELSRKYGLTHYQVYSYLQEAMKRGYLEALTRCPRKDYSGVEEGVDWTKQRLEAYLRKRPRLEKELKRRFGADFETLLEPGRYLKIPTESGDWVYSYWEGRIGREGRASRWKGFLCSDSHATLPVLVVQLEAESHQEWDYIQFAPLYDVHYGSEHHQFEEFRRYLNWIHSSPNTYTFIGGDLLENALEDGRGFTYDQSVPPGTQLSDMLHFLEPIVHKIWGAIPGNHELRTRRVAGIDPLEFIARFYSIPYVQGPLLMAIFWERNRWLFYLWHGRGGATTKSGKLNMMLKPRGYQGFCHFYISGHHHEPFVFAASHVDFDWQQLVVRNRTEYFVSVPSFLRYYPSYAYRGGWEPPASQWVCLRLYRNGDYEARLVPAGMVS